MAPYREPPPTLQPCPRCGRALGARAIAGERVDACPGCGGVFVEGKVLDHLIGEAALHDAVREAFPAGPTALHPGGPMYVPCPRCRKLMNRRQFALGASVVVDVCAGDGTWFDASELAKVLDFAAGGGLDRARRLEESRRAEEQREAKVKALLDQLKQALRLGSGL